MYFKYYYKLTMNRIEISRKYIDELLLNMTDVKERSCAYLYLYGVAQSCVLIALKRGENAELSTMAGMLHHIYSYAKIDTNDEETKMICDAIYNHSEKESLHSEFNEILKDADVFQHCLYNPMFEMKAHEKNRYEKLKVEFGIA